MKIKRPEFFFTFLILIFGTILLFITPAGANFDEDTYISRIWEMGLGHVMPNSYLGSGSNMPNAFLKVSYGREVNVPVMDWNTLQQQLQVKIDWHDFVKYPTRAVYFPTLFAIQAVIMRFFGAHLQLPVLTLYYMLRFSYLLLYCLLIFFTIKTVPFAKLFFGALAVAPICLIQAASVSSDPVIFGISFLFIAWVLKLCSDSINSLSKKEILITCLLILAMGTLKPNMIFLLLILLVIPVKRFSSNKARFAILISVFISIAISLGWSYFASQYFINRDKTGVNPIAQIVSLVSNPLLFFKSLKNIISTDSILFFKEAIGVSGNTRYFMPSVLYWVFPITVLIAFFTNRTKINLSVKQRIIFGVVGLINLFMVFIIFYIVETPQGVENILGVQGRYFIPFIPLLLLPFAFNWRFTLPESITGILVTLISIICVGTIFVDYYVVCGPSWYSKQVCTLPNYRNWDPSTFLGVNLDKETKIRQTFVVQCNELSHITLWVNKNEIIKGQEEYFVLENVDNKLIQSIVIKSEDVPASGWLTVNFSPAIKNKDAELQFELLSKDKSGIPSMELGYFPTEEYPRGSAWINNTDINSDLVFQYKCRDGISKALK